MRLRYPALLSSIIVLFLMSSCTLGYQRKWQRMAETQIAQVQPPQDLTGAWEGTWKSESSGHQGTLRAMVSREVGPEHDQTGGSYLFHYRATWAKVLSGAYRTKHQATRQGRSLAYKISGEHDMGRIFGGVFRYSGQATPTHFKAHYDSKLDQGVFELRRPEAPAR